MNHVYQHLGKSSSYKPNNNTVLLDPISRKDVRKSLNLDSQSNMQGFDRWFCYEVSALTPNFKPFNLTLYFDVACDSPFMVESKSLKLYLNSFNNCVFESATHFVNTLNKDLSACLQSQVSFLSFQPSEMFKNTENQYICLDDLESDQSFKSDHSLDISFDSSVQSYQYYYTTLFRSLCPVTNQPDWASVFLEFLGRKINGLSLLKYLCSYRECAMFHESCVEKIYGDIVRLTNCEKIKIYAHFLRRGGIALMPIRMSFSMSSPFIYDQRS